MKVRPRKIAEGCNHSPRAADGDGSLHLGKISATSKTSRQRRGGRENMSEKNLKFLEEAPTATRNTCCFHEICHRQERRKRTGGTCNHSQRARDGDRYSFVVALSPKTKALGKYERRSTEYSYSTTVSSSTLFDYSFRECG